METRKEAGGGVREEVEHRVAAELGIGRRWARVRQGMGVGRYGGGSELGQVYGVREGRAWIGKLRIWVGQGAVAENEW